MIPLHFFHIYVCFDITIVIMNGQRTAICLRVNYTSVKNIILIPKYISAITNSKSNVTIISKVAMVVIIVD